MVLPALLLAGLSGCGRKGEVTVKGEQRERILAIAEPIVDSLMASYNSGDYEAYISDFSENLKQAVTQEKFNETRQFIMDRIGRYIRRNQPNVKGRGGNLILTYEADFEQETEVELRVIFHAAGKELLVGNIRFISPRLQQTR